MVDDKTKPPNKFKDWAVRIAAATVKATLVYALYFLLS